MAIFNSIALGKTKGSIGNVTTTTLKGQSVAKQRNYNPANPKTPNQVNSRNRMANAVMAWKFLSVFFAPLVMLARPLESTYNAFVRLSKNLFTIILQPAGFAAAAVLDGEQLQGNSSILIPSLNSDGAGLTVTINTAGVPWSANLHVRTLCYDSADGSNKLIDRAITAIEWNAGTLTVSDAGVAFGQSAAVIYDSVAGICSSVYFSAL